MIYFKALLKWKREKEYIDATSHGKFMGNGLQSVYNENKLSAFNQDSYNEFLKGSPYVINITNSSDTELEACVATNIDFTDHRKWQAMLLLTFPECYLHSVGEITVETYKIELEQNRNGRGSKILDKLKLRYEDSYFDPIPFKMSENIPDYSNISRAECRKRAKEILASESFLEEIDRIYSKSNKKEYYGQPVHYFISAGEWGAAEDIIDILTTALYSNGRLLSGRQVVVRNVSSHAYRDDRFKQVLNAAEGGIAIIDLRSEDDVGRFASGFHELTTVAGKIVEKNKKDTLFIFVELTGKRLNDSDAWNNVTSRADFIEITEGSGTIGQAKNYLMKLANNSTITPESEESVVKFLPDAESYSVTDIYNAYNAWYGSGLKEHVYKAYKDQQTFKVAVREVESKPYDTLMSMTGLADAKMMLSRIIAASKISKARERMGLKHDAIALNMVFTGNPGTAKTTYARLMASILKDEDVLKTGKLIECGRQDLVGKYVGWTAKIVEQRFKEASGGILFIDEAYSLIDKENLYGAEAINTITQMMENYRDDVIVIFAGYPDKMKAFLEQNEGLKSRVGFHLSFPDYSEDELVDILRFLAKEREYTIDEDAIPHCRKIFEKAVRVDNYGNGRYVRNMLEQAILRQSDRIIGESLKREVSREDMCTLHKDDFDEVIQEFNDLTAVKMGFAI